MNASTPKLRTGRRTIPLLLAGPLLALSPACGPSAPPEPESRVSPVVRGYLATSLVEIDDRTTGEGERREVYLPDVEVWLENASDGERSEPVITDLSGRFQIPPQQPGRYRLCWRRDGFVGGCSNQILSVAGRPIHLSKVMISVERVPRTVTVVGEVTLSDGSLARTLEPMASINAFPRVALLDGGGSTLYEATVDNFGYYLLPQVPVEQDVVLRSTIEGLSVDQPIRKEADLEASPLHTVDLSLRNHPPRLEPLVATRADGSRVRAAGPGDVLRLEARGADRDGDPLRLRWLVAPGSGSVSDDAAPEVEWNLPSVPGRYTVTLIAFDGKGGYDRSELSLRADGQGILFEGRVSATDDAAVPGAEVEVNGETAKSNAAGHVRLFVPDAERFVFNIRKPGYGLYSRVYDDSVTGGRWTLTRASLSTVDPNAPIRVVNERSPRDCPGPRSSRLDWRSYPNLAQPQWQDGKGNVVEPFADLEVPLPQDARQRYGYGEGCGPGIRVEIPAGALVDADGNPPAGNVDVALSTVDLFSPEQMPGDYSVRTAGGAAFMQSWGAGTVEITAGGSSYDLAPGTTATVALPVDPTQLAAGPPPPTIPLLYYDEADGVWEQEGTATLVGNEYVATVEHFSAINTDLIKTDQACVRVKSPTLGSAYHLETTIPQGPGVAPNWRSDFIDNSSPSEHAIYNLPTDTNIVLVPVRIDNGIPYGTFVVNTGEKQNPTSPNRPAGPPYVACSTEVVLTEQAVPPPGGEFLKGLSTFEATKLKENDGSDAASPALQTQLAQTTQDYYDQIDPHDERLNLAAFRAKNGFDGTESHVVFANSADLGFGRDMYCKQNGDDVACYVTNYGDEASNDQTDANDAVIGHLSAGLGSVATVAMEYSRIADPPPADPDDFSDPQRVVKFYVYSNADSVDPTIDDRLVAANLDAQGTRPIPQLCMVCHNGAYPGGPTTGVPTFASRDDVKLGSRFLPFDLAGFTFPEITGWDKASQQTAFEALNNMVKATEPSGSAIIEVIDEMYPSPGVDQVESFVVTGWTGGALEQDFYREVNARVCRTCHISNDFVVDLPGVSAADDPRLNFRGASDVEQLLGQVEQRVCQQHVMPHALRTHDLFWTSVGPHMPAQLQAFGDTFGNAGNGWVGTNCGVYTAGGTTPASDFQSIVVPIFEGTSTSAAQACTNCHIGNPGSGGLNLQPAGAHGNLVGVSSEAVGVGIDRVTANDVANSFLVHKLEGTHASVGDASGGQMPLNQPPLDANPHIDDVKSWINGGAPP